MNGVTTSALLNMCLQRETDRKRKRKSEVGSEGNVSSLHIMWTIVTARRRLDRCLVYFFFSPQRKYKRQVKGESGCNPEEAKAEKVQEREGSGRPRRVERKRKKQEELVGKKKGDQTAGGGETVLLLETVVWLGHLEDTRGTRLSMCVRRKEARIKRQEKCTHAFKLRV